jgi:hypothetical protein
MKQQPTWRGHRAPVEGVGESTTARPRARSRQWSVALLAVIALAAVATGIVAAVQNAGPDTPPRLPPVAIGTCLISPELARASDGVTELEAVACSRAHDGEVFALLTLRADEDLDAAGSRCVGAAAVRQFDFEELRTRGLEVRPLALDGNPTTGDTVACFVRRKDGAPQRGAAFATPQESDR